jgi:hypothetical protein
LSDSERRGNQTHNRFLPQHLGNLFRLHASSRN